MHCHFCLSHSLNFMEHKHWQPSCIISLIYHHIDMIWTCNQPVSHQETWGHSVCGVEVKFWIQSATPVEIHSSEWNTNVWVMWPGVRSYECLKLIFWGTSILCNLTRPKTRPHQYCSFLFYHKHIWLSIIVHTSWQVHVNITGVLLTYWTSSL